MGVDYNAISNYFKTPINLKPRVMIIIKYFSKDKAYKIEEVKLL